MKTFFVSLAAILCFSACTNGAEKVMPEEIVSEIEAVVVTEEIQVAKIEIPADEALLEFGETLLGDGEQIFLDSGSAKAIESETDLWNVYENEAAGFSLKYSGLLGEDFRVEVTPIEELEGAMGYNLATAQLNEVKLAEGKYGEDVDFPIGVSKKVRSLGEINAQEFMVLGRFEICDVTMERKLYFFANGHQVVVTFVVPREELIAAAPEYFVEDTANCGAELIWDFEKQDEFYNSLVAGEGVEVVQDAFERFDEMVGTIEFVE